MSKTVCGAFPAIHVTTNEDLCREVPEIICKAYHDCGECPFNGIRQRAGVLLIIEREPDHEKN